VHRTTGSWTPTVHAFLQHLEDVGFRGAPRVLGIDAQDREILAFIEGDVLADPTWSAGNATPWPLWAQTDEALVASAQLLRELHEASASFTPSDAIWKQYEHAHLLPGEIVCHGDIGPHNTVYRDGVPVAFIDWETIRPNQRLIELGIAAWHYVPLGDDDYFARSGFGSTPDLPYRLHRFATSYGVTDPAAVIWGIQQAKQRSVEAMRYWRIKPSDGAQLLRIVARELSWLNDATDDLLRAF
jgi:Ser/Thr protein kinase RdoA (MazF antagonist)